MHLEMDITGSKLSYVAGDHVAIFPVNDPQWVERMGQLLNTELDTPFTLTNVDGELRRIDMLQLQILRSLFEVQKFHGF